MKNKTSYILFLSSIFVLNSAKTATKNDPHLPISHCYHWLDESNSKFLTFKYQYSQRTNGELAFYTTPSSSNGAVAGAGLYCAKSPSGSYSYGDRVIKVNLSDDIVLLDNHSNKKYCGYDGKFYLSQKECDSKPWDIKFYRGGGAGNYAWYVIRNPQAIKSWSANSQDLISDIKRSKKLNGSSFINHADRTLLAINKEISKRGQATIDNIKGRTSIIQMLKKPKELAKIPPLTIIERVVAVKNKNLSSSKKAAVYLQQFKRALKDSLLNYSDFSPIANRGGLVLTQFKKALLHVVGKDITQINSPIILMALDNLKLIKSIQKKSLVKLWSASLSGSGSLDELEKHKFKNTISNQESFELAIEEIEKNSLISKIKSYNLTSTIALLNKYALTSSVNYFNIYKDIVTALISTGNSYTLKVIKSVDNKLLGSQRAIKEILIDLDAKSFTGISPMNAGALLDYIAKDIDDQLKDKLITRILNLPLIINKVPTYMILDNLKAGKVTLPSFYSKNLFLKNLVHRSIAERSQASPTNTYRFILSGLYHYFNDQIKVTKIVSEKAKIIKEAQSLFDSLSKSLNSPESAPYAYAALQNASLFSTGQVYKEHPIASYFKNYQTGDISFDKSFKKITTQSLDASFFYFLVRMSPKSTKAKKLLDETILFLNSTKLQAYLKTKNFSISEKEKRSWSNIVFNKAYRPSRGGRVRANMCHLLHIVYTKQGELSKVLKPNQLKLLSSSSTNMYKTYCR